MDESAATIARELGPDDDVGDGEEVNMGAGTLRVGEDGGEREDQMPG